MRHDSLVSIVLCSLYKPGNDINLSRKDWHMSDNKSFFKCKSPQLVLRLNPFGICLKCVLIYFWQSLLRAKLFKKRILKGR